MISLEEFLQLPTCQVAQLVQDSGPKVVVFPINGTRRWFILEHGQQEWDDPFSAYMEVASGKYIELFRLFFEHGIETLLTPIIGAEILDTRDSYMQNIGAKGLARLATDQGFLSFYDEYDVRVRFYGDYQKSLARTPYGYVSDLLDNIAQKTKHHKKYRLFFGAFADQMLATEFISEFAIRYYIEHGKAPERKAIIEMYYGDSLEKADIFIGFDRFAVFDYPMLNWGDEDLYFTVAPSLYMTQSSLRQIIFDYLYSRQGQTDDYPGMSQQQLHFMRDYYHSNLEKVFGVGKKVGDIWYPSLNLIWPINGE